MDLFSLLKVAIRASFEAGREILAVYDTSFAVESKDDHSPLTLADTNANRVILENLKSTGIPAISEETEHASFDERRNWEYLWLIDPLDGTREFVNRNGEFTVNIALIHRQTPILGVVYTPVSGKLIAGIIGHGLYILKATDENALLANSSLEGFRFHPKSANSKKSPALRVALSRSHRDQATEDYLEKIRKEYSALEYVYAGSALKFCILAEGEADLYPRPGTTMEWDTAAGHAILKSVGKNIMNFHTGAELTYNKPDFRNDWFIAK